MGKTPELTFFRNCVDEGKVFVMMGGDPIHPWNDVMRKTINENSIPLPLTDARPAGSQESTRSCSTGAAAELSV